MVSWKIQRLTEANLLDSIDDCSFNQYSFSSVPIYENLKKETPI